jgi:outer membrane protein assembly factor BamA
VRRREAALRVAAFAAAATLLLTGQAAAQVPQGEGVAAPRRSAPRAPKPDPWFLRYLLYPTWDSDEGLMAHFSFGWRHGPNRRPPAVSKALSLDTRIATSGTRGAYLTYDAPGWWRDWRVLGQLGTERLQRAPFYGAGNSSSVADSLATRYYRYSLLRTTVMATVQRRLLGPLRLHTAIAWRHYHARPLNTASAFGTFVAAGAATDSMPFSVLELRGGLLYDTRDFENTPTRGVFLEAMAAHAASGGTYDRYLLSAREFVPLGEYQQWVLGFRQTAELASGDLPLAIAYERLTTWYPDDGFGGASSLRLYAPGRFLAPNRAIASFDARHKVLDAPFPTSPYRVWILGFADVGRLWNTGETPSFSGAHWSAGIGGRLQFGKGSLFGLDVGGNDERFGLSVVTAFAF